MASSSLSLLSPPQCLKKLAADKVVEYVKSEMILDLDTGSTASFVVSKLGELLKSDELKDIIGVQLPSAQRTKLASWVDNSDEVDLNLDLVKRRSGALLRQKMVEAE